MVKIAGKSLLIHKVWSRPPAEVNTAPGIKIALEMERTNSMREDLESSLLLVLLQLSAMVINMNQGEKLVPHFCFNFASFKGRSWETACLIYTQKLSH